jgi:hypothetical protein
VADGLSAIILKPLQSPSINSFILLAQLPISIIVISQLGFRPIIIVNRPPGSHFFPSTSIPFPIFPLSAIRFVSSVICHPTSHCGSDPKEWMISSGTTNSSLIPLDRSRAPLGSLSLL